MKRDPIPATAILYLYSLGLLLSLMLQACGPAGSPILEQAAGLVESSPDSALRLLNTLDSGALNRRDAALYQVLRMRAKDKNGGDIRGDTLVFESRDYLVSIKDRYAALACFVAANVHDVRADAGRALRSHLMALELADDHNDTQLKGMISYNLGRIYYHHTLYDESLACARQAKRYDERAGVRGESKGYTLEFLGASHLSLSQPDSAILYFNRALMLAEHPLTRGRLNLCIAMAYHNTHVYSLAKKSYLQALPLLSPSDSSNRGKCYLGLAGIYDVMGQTDSAFYFANLTKRFLEHSDDVFDWMEIYRLLASIGNDLLEKAVYQQLDFLAPKFQSYFDKEKILVTQSEYLREVIRSIEGEKERLVLQRRIHFLIILNLLFVVAAGVYFFRHYRNKQSDDVQARENRFEQEKSKQQAEHQAALQQQASDYQIKLQQQQADLLAERELLKEEIESIRRALQDNVLKLLFRVEDIAKLGEKINSIHSTADASICRQMNVILAKQNWNEVYPVLHRAYGDLLKRFRDDFKLDKQHWRTCCIAYAGFDSYTVSAVLNEKRSTSKNRLSELRKLFGLSDRSNIQKFLNRHYGINEVSDDESAETVDFSFEEDT